MKIYEKGVTHQKSILISFYFFMSWGNFWPKWEAIGYSGLPLFCCPINKFIKIITSASTPESNRKLSILKQMLSVNIVNVPRMTSVGSSGD